MKAKPNWTQAMWDRYWTNWTVERQKIAEPFVYDEEAEITQEQWARMVEWDMKPLCPGCGLRVCRCGWPRQ